MGKVAPAQPQATRVPVPTPGVPNQLPAEFDETDPIYRMYFNHFEKRLEKVRDHIPKGKLNKVIGFLKDRADCMKRNYDARFDPNQTATDFLNKSKEYIDKRIVQIMKAETQMTHTKCNELLAC